MLVQDWMQRRVHSVKPLDSIKHARDVMEEHRINQLPVVVDGHVVGIITDRDVRAAFPSVFESPLFGKSRKNPPSTDPEKVTVEMVMSANVLTMAPTDALVEAAKLMRRERVGALPIVSGDRLVGVLTRSDILAAFIASPPPDSGK